MAPGSSTSRFTLLTSATNASTLAAGSVYVSVAENAGTPPRVVVGAASMQYVVTWPSVIVGSTPAPLLMVRPSTSSDERCAAGTLASASPLTRLGVPWLLVRGAGLCESGACKPQTHQEGR